MRVVCGKTGAEDEDEAMDEEEEQVLYDATEEDGSDRPFYWSNVLQQSFREELEK